MDSKPVPVPAPPSKPFGLIFWVYIVVGVLLSLSTARVWANGEWTGEAQGYAFGILLLPALIAYLLAGRRKVRNPAAFGLWFCGLCLLFFLLELSHHAAH
jgi:tryptophan-rich sensory protein